MSPIAYARITFNSGAMSGIEVGLDSLDDPAALEPLVKNTYALWQMAVEDAEDES